MKDSSFDINLFGKPPQAWLSVGRHYHYWFLEIQIDFYVILPVPEPHQHILGDTDSYILFGVMFMFPRLTLVSSFMTYLKNLLLLLGGDRS